MKVINLQDYQLEKQKEFEKILGLDKMPVCKIVDFESWQKKKIYQKILERD